MYTERITLFDDGDAEIIFSIKVYRQGLLESVVVDWYSLRVDYIGDRDIKIDGIQALQDFTVGYSNEPSITPSVVIYQSDRNYWIGNPQFLTETKSSVPYNSARLFMASGVVSVHATDNATQSQSSATANLIDQSLYRQHGDTESWGSSNKKDLFFPWQNVRL